MIPRDRGDPERKAGEGAPPADGTFRPTTLPAGKKKRKGGGEKTPQLTSAKCSPGATRLVGKTRQAAESRPAETPQGLMSAVFLAVATMAWQASPWPAPSPRRVAWRWNSPLAKDSPSNDDTGDQVNEPDVDDATGASALDGVFTKFRTMRTAYQEQVVQLASPATLLIAAHPPMLPPPPCRPPRPRRPPCPRRPLTRPRSLRLRSPHCPSHLSPPAGRAGAERDGREEDHRIGDRAP